MGDQHGIPPMAGVDLLTLEKVTETLGNIPQLKAGVIGDGCLDIYWHADMTISELSRETPHHNFPIIKEEYKLGAACNVAANLKALGCGEVYLCTVFGDDWRGKVLRDKLQAANINGDYILYDQERVTPAYCKPILHGVQEVQQEAPRIDFVNTAGLSESIINQLLVQLDQMAERVDIIGVTDQLKYGVVGSAVRERLAYWSSQGKIVVADSRDRIGLFQDVIVKPNEIEVLAGVPGNPDDPEISQWEKWISAGIRLSLQVNAPVCVTLGERGALWIENKLAVYIPTVGVEPPIDIVGAGDCFTASLMSALGAGCSGPVAAAFAHLGASVAVKKLGETGSASAEEILIRFAVVSLPTKVL